MASAPTSTADHATMAVISGASGRMFAAPVTSLNATWEAGKDSGWIDPEKQKPRTARASLCVQYSFVRVVATMLRVLVSF